MEENAAKALLMAAGMIITVLLISLLVVLYNEISEYYAQNNKMAEIEQMEKFNAKFENYHRSNIRGSELISLMNRVIDYNASESYFEGTGYKRIRVTITLVEDGKNEDMILNQFQYETNVNTSRNKYLINEITNTRGADWQNDRKLTEITNTPSDLSSSLNGYGITFVSDAQLQKLASQIESIMIEDETENSSWAVYNRLKRAELIKKVLGKEVKIDSNTGKTKNESKALINDVKEMASKYYQYMQFKRACFECVEVKYDTETNRVVEMNFKLQTKIVNGVDTVIFD